MIFEFNKYLCSVCGYGYCTNGKDGVCSKCASMNLHNNNNEEYIGAGVKAHFDGYVIELSLNKHITPVGVICLDKETLGRLNEFAKRCKL